MCGRFANSEVAAVLARLFGTTNPVPPRLLSYNVSPGHDALVVRHNRKTGARHLDPLEWGLGASDEQYRPHNIKAEEIEDTDELSQLLERGYRCLVPVNVFYVWHKLPSGKKPFAVGRLSPRELYGVRRHPRTIALAGLWHGVQLPNGVKRTFAIITSGASGVINVLQDRMPVVVDEADWPLWLGERHGDVRDVLARADQTAVQLRAWQVSGKVSRQDTDGVELMEPLYEVFPGDPLLIFEVAEQAIAAARTRLEGVRQRYHAAVEGRPQIQQDEAFKKTVAYLEGWLVEAQRFCAQMSSHKFPPNTYREPVEPVIGMRERHLRMMQGLPPYKPPQPPPPLHTNPGVVQQCFGHREQMVKLSRALNYISQLLASWHWNVDQPWADPHSFSSSTGYTASRNRLQIEDFLFETPLNGGCDLARLAAAIPEAADSIVTDVERVVCSDHPNSLCRRQG